LSVINRVLRDLDGNRAPRDLPDGVHSVAEPAPARRPLWPWLLAMIAGLSVFAFLASPKPAPPPRETPSESPSVIASAARQSSRTAVSSQQSAISNETGSPHPATLRSRLKAAPRDDGFDQRLSNPSATPILPDPAPAEPASVETVAQPAPAKPAEPPARVVKEARAPSPRELAEAVYAKALRQVEAGRSRDALARLDEALALDPGHLGARQTSVALAQETGDSARAESLLREGLALHPGEAWLARNLGQILVQHGDPAGAAQVLATGLVAGDADYRAFYAGVLAKAGRPEAAAAEYRAALRASPGQGAWWLGLGLALERLGQRAEAAAAYERAAQTRLAPELREFVSKKRAELN
jgi:MSHA biogenesis protein MshN